MTPDTRRRGSLVRVLLGGLGFLATALVARLGNRYRALAMRQRTRARAQAALREERERLLARERAVSDELRARIRQLQALATFGQRAFIETDADALFDAAVTALAEQLDVEYVELLELLPGEHEFLLRAGKGWKEGLVGRARVHAGRQSQAGYTLLTTEPVLLEDLRTETRFRPTPLLAQHDVVSGVTVVIRGREHPWGVLGAHTLRRRRFSPDDSYFVQSLANILGEVIELRRSDADRELLLERERTARAEAERRRHEAERAIESRARLMRGFTHDVKNPLGAADGFLELLEDGVMDALTPRQLEGVQLARRSMHAALDLIEDLLGLAHVEAGSVDVEPTIIDVRRAAEQAAEEYRAQAAAKGLAIHVDAPAELPPVESDPARVRQVLSNLVSNAVKYTARGGITLRIHIRSDATAPGPGRWAALDVTDTGPGIPRDQRPLLFREFTRLAAAGAEEGAGLGLAISRRIARALGGDLTVESEVGKGSTFTLWLPLDHAARAGPRAAAA